MNIKFRTQRQFDATIYREGKDIVDFFSGDTYRVFFRSMKHSDSTTGKLRLYYNKDLPIARGTVFSLCGSYYLVINQDAIESEIYNTSVAVRCTQLLKCGGLEIPFVVSELKNVYPKSSSVMSVLNGAITLYTGDNSYYRSVDINDEYQAFGGVYRVVNTFYNDGIGYIYLTREVQSTTYTLEYDGVTTLVLTDGTYQLTYSAYVGSAYVGSAVVSSPNLTYTSNNETVATVSDTGLLTMVGAGEVTITANWTEHNVNCETTLVIESGEPPEQPINLSCNVSGDTKLKVGYNRTLTATVMNNDEDVTSTSTFVWSISDFTGALTTDMITMTPNGEKCIFYCEDEDVIDETFTVTVTATYGDVTATGSMAMRITGIFG